MPYVIFFTTIGLNFFMLTKSQGIPRKIFKTILFAEIVLFAGLRASNVGSDTPTYVGYFNMAESFDNFRLLALSIEPGYLGWTFLSRAISDSSFAFLMLTSLAQAALLYKILANSKNYIFLFIYIFLFYLNFHFNTIRVGFAVLFFLCFLTEKKKYLKNIFLIVAPTFHVSILFFYPFFAMKWDLKSIAIALFAVITFAAVFPGVIQMFVDKAVSYSGYLEDGGAGVSALGLVFVLMIGSSLFLHRHSSHNFKISAVLLLLIYAAKAKFPILYRLAFIAQFFYLFYLTVDLNQKIHSKQRILVLWPIVGALFILQLYNIVTEKAALSSRFESGDLSAESLDAGYLPYEFIWQDPRE